MKHNIWLYFFYISLISLFVLSCSSKKYTKADGERIFTMSAEMQVDPRLIGVDVEKPIIIEDTCMMTTDFDYQNSGLSMDSYIKIDANDYKKYFSRSGKYDFYLHPIVCNDNVFDIKNDGKIIAYSLQSGKVKKLWSKNLLSSKEKKNISISQARLEDDILYIATNNGFVIAFNVKNKEILWKKHFDSSFTASPSLNDENLFLVSSSDEVYAINKESGELVWRYADAERTNITSFQIPPVAIYQGKIVACLANGEIMVFDKDGGIIWKNKISNTKDSMNIIDINDIDFPPMLFQNVLVAGGIKTSIMGFDFNSGQPIWQIPAGLNSYLFHNNHGFGFFVSSNNEKVCFHIASGAIKSIEQDLPFSKKIDMPGYLNYGSNIKTININRYYDVI